MLFQFLPRLSDDEYTALEKSIVEHGVQVPIVVDENDSIIDGHHRKEIADRLGIGCPRRTASGLDETQKRTLACSLNLDRRHLTQAQKREVVEKSLKADPHLSNRQHAERTGVDHKTVGTQRQALQRRGEIPHVDQHTDSLGRQQPARVESVEPEASAEPDQWSKPHAEDSAAHHVGDSVVAAGPPAPEQGSTPAPGAVPKQRRTPLTDSIRNASTEAEKKLTTLRDLTRDDRWPQNAEKVAPRLRNDLLRISDLLQQVERALPELTQEDTHG